MSRPCCKPERYHHVLLLVYHGSLNWTNRGGVQPEFDQTGEEHMCKAQSQFLTLFAGRYVYLAPCNCWRNAIARADCLPREVFWGYTTC